MNKLTERELRDWDEFDDIVRPMPHRRWVFRGQCNASDTLESSLYRGFREVQTITRQTSGKPKPINHTGHERLALERFMNSAHLYLPHLPPRNQPLEWFAIMQHYGAPTRLLDFTFSPYIAAYFALEFGTGDCAIYCFNRTAFEEADSLFFKNVQKLYSDILDQDNDDVIYVFEPEFPTERLLAQQGVFLVPGSLHVPHEDIVAKYKMGDNELFKLVIPSHLRTEGLKHLRRTNVCASVLFPGLDGFCRSFRYPGLFLYKDEKRAGKIEPPPASVRKARSGGVNHEKLRGGHRAG